jgi:hypothetical protein
MHDHLFTKVLGNIRHHKTFELVDSLLYTHNRENATVLCIPSTIHNKRCLTEVIIVQAHEVLGHFGPQKTTEYICWYYWWPRIGQDIELYCKTCPICQTMKASTMRVPGLLHCLPIPTRPWGSIAMDFVGLFPESNGYNYLWVVICHLTSMVHLVPLRTTTTVRKLASLYIHKIVQLCYRPLVCVPYLWLG